MAARTSAHARAQWDSAFEDGHCDRATLECDALGLERSRSARRDANLANLTVAVGALSAVVGIVLFVRARPERKPRTAPSVRVEPALQPDGLSVAVTGRF